MWQTDTQNGWLIEGSPKTIFLKVGSGENEGGDVVRRQGITISKSQHQTEDEVKTSLSKTIATLF